MQTNIVILDVGATGWAAADLAASAVAQGVRIYAVGPTLLRLVWHLDVDDAATDVAVEVLTGLLRSGPSCD